MKKDDHRGLTYDDFRLRAKDDTWTDNEKIGFPDAYRAGAEAAIFADVLAKLPALNGAGRTIVDIGCGCGPLAHVLMAHCAEHGHRLIMVDSAEMLDLLPPSPGTELRPHRFPRDPAFLDEFRGAVDAVLLYSVIHHEFASGDLWTMFDAVCGLLAGGGRALFGDIPNRSMRTRLFQSPNGRAFHRAFTGLDTEPPVPEYGLVPGEIDDAVVFALLMRARSQGIHGFVLPQSEGLPFANRREDVLLQHP
ncbi:MAG: class I SAM-dependent methyltransferase [Candidatus Eremiobacteraeota bacterium]|nr:class I SAM-dependent methyltransferase [Candidatus Eremiobacteraeota bacterium]